MAVSPLLDFLKGAITFARTDESVAGDDLQARRDLAFHRRVVRLSGGCGVLGLMSGIFLGIPELAREAADKVRNDPSLAYVLAPLMSTIAGILFGFSLSCLLASRPFFLSPLGRRFLRIIGNDSVPLARFVSLVLVVLSGGWLIGPLALLLVKR